jgi:hypothetical protein
MIIAHLGGESPQQHGPQGACSSKRIPFVHLTASATSVSQPTAAALGLLPHHWAELQASAIAPDVAAANVASWGTGTDRHWERERAQLVAHARLAIQTGSTTASGHPQGQAGFLADRLIRLDSRYRHLQAGGWRSLSDALPGLPGFDQWKPDQARPRADKPGQAIKYEAPPGFPDGGGLLLPRVPDRCWELICERQGLPFPDAEARADGFWAWAMATPALVLLICEGWKKALAAVGAGWAAVALPGVQMGRRVGSDGSARLIPALQLLGASDRPWLIAFDVERRATTAEKVGGAAGALAKALRAAGGRVAIARLPLLPGADKTGLDDLLAADGPDALAKALANTGPRPVLPRLREPVRVAPAGARLHDAAPIPDAAAARVVAYQGPMGVGKTFAIGQGLAPYLAKGVPVLNLTHRVTLGQAQSEAWGLAWAPEPGSDQRLQGAGLCWDSCCPNSGLRIRPGEWGGVVVVLDEWAQGVEHLLFGHGTALAQRRPAVLETAAQLLATARQIIASDAQLSDPVLRLLEALSGERAQLTVSEHRPMAGRRLICPQGLTAAEASKRGRGKVLELIEAGRPFFCWSSCQTAGSRNSPQNLARLHRQRRPDARLLVIDSDNPEAAERLAADPDGVAAEVDAIYCSPSIASGLSIDLRNRFAAVVVLGGGTVGPEHLAQAAARVRDPGCPVFVFCPKQSPGGALRVGSGDTDPAALLRHLARCEAQLLAQLTAAGGWDPMARNESPWLRCWLELAALKNRQRLAYAATVAGLLEREGWAIEAPPEPTPAAIAAAAMASDQLADIARDAQEAEDQALIAAAPLTAAEARELERKRKRTPAERAQLARHALAHRWGLGAADPTPALIEADRDELSSRARMGWILRSIEGRQLAARHDARRSQQLAPDGQAWGPDLVRELLGHRIAAADALGLPGWLERADSGEWFTATDEQLLQLQERLAGRPRPDGGEALEQEAQRLAFNARAAIDRAAVVASLGVTPGKRATTTLRSLLALAGFELEPKRTRGPDGQLWRYRVRPSPLPDGADRQQLETAWRDQLADPGGG